MTEPTAEQCNTNAKLFVDDWQTAYAYWYPQMGGYTSKSIILVPTETDEEYPCFEAYIWHDGEFPFSDEAGNPAHIHHCSAEQFIDFGNFVKSVCGDSGKRLGWEGLRT